MKKASRFYASLGWLIILNAIIKPLWIFGIDRQVQNHTGTEGYGTYFSLMNLGIVLNFLLDWGLTTYYNRRLAFSGASNAREAGSLLLLKLLFAITYAIVISIIAVLTGIRSWNLLVFVIAIQVLTYLFLFFRAIITAQQWFITDAWMSVVDKFLMILFCGVLIYAPKVWGPMTIQRFVELQTVCTLLAVLIALAIVLRNGFRFSFSASWPEKRIFREALPFGLIVLFMSFHSRIDGFLLDRLYSAGEAGKYAAAYRLLDAANMVGYLFASFFLPYIARLMGENKSIAQVVLNIRHLLALFAIIVICTGVFEAGWLQDLLYHHDDRESARILQWCLPALAGYVMVQVYGTVMTATGHIVSFCYIMFFSALLNGILNLWLIPGYGAWGSCAAAIASQLGGGVATTLYCRQKLKLPLHIRSLLIYTFIATLLCGFYYTSRDWGISKWLITAAAGSLAIVAGWLTRLLDPAAFVASSREK